MIVRGIPRESRSSSGPYKNEPPCANAQGVSFLWRPHDRPTFGTTIREADCGAGQLCAHSAKLRAIEPGRSQSRSSSGPVLCEPLAGCRCKKRPTSNEAGFFICTRPDTTYFRYDNARSALRRRLTCAHSAKLRAIEPGRSQSRSSSGPEV